MNRKTLTYASLAVAAAAFLVDRIFLGEPTAVQADVPVVESTTSAAPTNGNRSATERRAAQPPGPPAPSAMTYLSRLPDAPDVPRDAFVPSAALLQHYHRIEEATRQEKQGQDSNAPGSPRLFVDTHRLQATFIGTEGMMAIVDGRIVRVGDEMDGFKIVRITADTAEFQREGHAAILRLPLPARAR